MSTLKLNVDSLNVRFVNGKKEMHAVRDVSFTLGREKLAIVGESGSCLLYTSPSPRDS